MSIQSIGQPLHATAVTSHAHGEVQSSSGQNKVHHNLASHYTSLGLGSRVQPGKVLNTSLKWLTLSAPARKIGIAIQGGHDSHALSVKGKARYWTGALIKGLANITGGVSSVASGAVAAGAAGVKNLGESAARLVASSSLGLAGAVMKGASHLPLGMSERLQQGSQQALSAAKEVLKPAFVAKAEQEPLTVEGARAVMDAAQLARVSCSSSYREMPSRHAGGHSTLYSGTA